MAWIFLLTAGALEVAWAAGLKRLALGYSFTTVALTGLAMLFSLLALYVAMERLPLGIAYPIWTGIGSVGAVVVSVFIFQQQISASTIFGVALLVAGMLLIGADAH